MSGLSFNEDDSHFFLTRPAEKMTIQGLQEMVDHYVTPEMKELIFCANCMRTNCRSDVWDEIWKGYDPDAGDDQPIFLEHRKYESEFDIPTIRRWVHNAWLLDQKGIDPYQVWLDYTRKKNISPWISMRMNDVHDVHNPCSVLHSDFWRKRPDLRRVPYRFETWPDRAFDYGQKEVRDYHMSLIREYLERYDMDGLELDWMRFGYHFRPGQEQSGGEHLTEFMTNVRKLTEQYAWRHGHSIKLGVRVPSRPEAAAALGMDAVRWAQKGLVDMIVAASFWTTTDCDIPIELWKALLADHKVILAAGLESRLAPFPAAWKTGAIGQTPETVRGLAASYLQRGADRIYLYNYMDSEPMTKAPPGYREMLDHPATIETAAAHPRRHLITYPDTLAPGQPVPTSLPARCSQTQTAVFRIHTGPKPQSATVHVFLGLADQEDAKVPFLQTRVNGKACLPSAVSPPKITEISQTAVGFDVDPSVLNDGYNVIEVIGTIVGDWEIVWAEIMICPKTTHDNQ